MTDRDTTTEKQSWTRLRRHLRRAPLPFAGLALSLVAAGCQLPTPPPTNLGAVGFGTIVADDTRGQALVSGPTANVVNIINMKGAVVGRIPNLYGAWGLVVNGNTLFVAESTAGAIVKVDLTNPGAAPTQLASGLNSPSWLVETGGKLWTVVGSDHLTSVDETSGAVTNFPTAYYGADPATSPSAGNTIFVAEDGLSPGTILRLDVSSGAPVVVVSTFTNQANLEGLAISPDGTRVIPAAGVWQDGSGYAHYSFEELSAKTLLPDGVVYPGDAYPSAVATSANGVGRVATGLSNGYSTTDISVAPIGTPASIYTAQTTNNSGTSNVLSHGLALSGDGHTLWAATANDVYHTNTLVSAWTLL